MTDFICRAVSGEIRTSEESLAVEWVERDQVLERIIRLPIRERMRDMLEFQGTVVYRSYEFSAGEVNVDYSVHQNRKV